MVDVIQPVNGEEGARGSMAGEMQSVVALNRCNNSRCLTCADFNENPNFKSTVTGKMYSVITTNHQVLSCKTKNVVYLLTCKKCLSQYVGETKQQFNVRNNAHRRSTKSVDVHTGCPVVHEHFTEGLCNGMGYTCHILEKIPDVGSDRDQQNLRRQREQFWIKELRTVTPFGLNSRLDTGNLEGNRVNSCFNKLSRYRNRKRGRGRGRGREWIIEDIMNEIKEKLSNSVNEVIRFCCKTLPQIPRTKLKALAQCLLDTEVPESIQNIAIKYITNCNVVRNDLNSNKKRVRNQLSLKFINKGVEMINLGRILHDRTIKDAFPLENAENPMIVYSYTKPVRNKIVNYRQTVQSTVYEEWVSAEGRCGCQNSPFVDEHHGHVITGDLSIVENVKLKRLLSKGPNYREPKTTNWKNAKKEILSGVSNFVNTQCERKGLPTAQFSEWKSKITETVNSRINHLKQQYPYYRPSRSVFSDEAASDELRRLQDNYVIAVVDKAGRNYSFTCKWYYLKIIYNEIGILDVNNNNNNTYERINEDEAEVIQNQVNFLQSVNIRVKPENQNLPFMYWIPKFHKNPVKARFIVSSSVCATKELASLISKALKLIMKGRKKYCDAIEEYSGTKRWWVIDNNLEVLKMINNINEKHQAKSVATYDFSTLYTNIPLDSLITALLEVINKCFENSKRKYITISNSEASWDATPSKIYFSFSKTSLVSSVQFLINNTYFKCGDITLKQNIGIPMGTDPGPDFANLFLHFYEFKFMKDNTKTNYGICKKLSKGYRYIDDILEFNCGSQFEISKGIIYPNELVLNKENVSDDKASFLDMQIEIIDKRFVTKLYDKRKDFNFQIVNFPYLCGNIPKKQSYGVFISQIIRYCRVCSEYENFIEECRLLVRKLLSQGYKKEIMKYYCDKRSDLFLTIYNKNVQAVKNDIFNFL